MAAGSLRRSYKKILLVLLGTFCALRVQAALSWQPEGTDIQVNSYTLSDQIRPAVATDASGNFVVLWLDKVRGLFLRRFDATGAPLTGELRVDDPPIPASWLVRQDVPRLAMDGRNGNFAVVYSSADGIWFRRFNAIAQPLERIGLPYNSAGESPARAGRRLRRRWQSASGLAGHGPGSYAHPATALRRSSPARGRRVSGQRGERWGAQPAAAGRGPVVDRRPDYLGGRA